MPDIKAEDKYGFYICGQCGSKIEYLITDGISDKCPDCDYEHLDRDKYDVPSEIKLDLTQY